MSSSSTTRRSICRAHLLILVHETREKVPAQDEKEVPADGEATEKNIYLNLFTIFELISIFSFLFIHSSTSVQKKK